MRGLSVSRASPRISGCVSAVYWMDKLNLPEYFPANDLHRSWIYGCYWYDECCGIILSPSQSEPGKTSKVLFAFVEWWKPPNSLSWLHRLKSRGVVRFLILFFLGTGVLTACVHQWSIFGSATHIDVVSLLLRQLSWWVLDLKRYILRVERGEPWYWLGDLVWCQANVGCVSRYRILPFSAYVL